MNRIVVIDTVYHAGESSPVVVETKYSVTLTSDEQPYLRRFKSTSGWTRLDCGWLTECSLLVLSNQGEDDVELSVYSSVFNVFSVVRPGHSVRLSPPDLSVLYIRGESKVQLSVFPR